MASFPISLNVDLGTEFTGPVDFYTTNLFPASLKGHVESITFMLDNPGVSDGATPSAMVVLKLRRRTEEPLTLWSRNIVFARYGETVSFDDRIGFPDYLGLLDVEFHRTGGVAAQFGTLHMVLFVTMENER